MAYAIMQNSLQPPSTIALRNAFRELPSLTDLDAANMAKTAYGIIVRGLPYNQAETLHHALARQGVGTTIVEDQRLPLLPPATQCRRIDCLENSLVIYNHLGQPATRQWREVSMASAGSVVEEKQKKIEKKRVVRRASSTRFGGIRHDTVTDVSYRTVREPTMVVEIWLLDAAPPLRYRIDGENFSYQYLGSRLQPSRPQNFRLLLADLYRLTAHALHNRGLIGAASPESPLPAYPSTATYREEVTWLLWRRASGQA